MTYPRKHLINLKETQFYHCVARCVRRAYLCGRDPISGRSYEHRRAWVEKRLLLLCEIFNIDVFAYAVMHNHTHIVLHVNLSENNALSDSEVLRRWGRLFKLEPICMNYLKATEETTFSQFEQEQIAGFVNKIRERLRSISWFMSSLNQYIARKANAEDECTGRFWEGRFKSQALLTEEAILACMTYVDLNPVRANISSRPESSLHTSINRRLHITNNIPRARLHPFGSKKRLPERGFLEDIPLVRYLAHLNEIANARQSQNRKTIRFGDLCFNQDWIKRSHQFEEEFSYVAGPPDKMHSFRKQVRGQMRAPQLAISSNH